MITSPDEAPPLTAAEVETIARRHVRRQVRDSECDLTWDECRADTGAWPCDAARAFATLRTQRAALERIATPNADRTSADWAEYVAWADAQSWSQSNGPEAWLKKVARDALAGEVAHV